MSDKEENDDIENEPESDDSDRPVFDTIVNCICGITETDKFINPETNEPRREIECDSCYTWQHVYCVIGREPKNAFELDNIKYICKNCVKRKYRTNRHEWLVIDMLETGFIPCLDDDFNFENKIVNGAWWEERKWERMVVKKDEETGIEFKTDLGPDIPGKSFNGKRWVDFEEG